MVDTTTGQSIVVKDQFYDGYGEMLFGVDAMTFGDGATVGRGDLAALIQASAPGGA
jgi:hypothetical protein